MIRQRFQKHFRVILLFSILIYVLCYTVGCSTDFLSSVGTEDFVIHFIDVGQGDCSLIGCNGKYMLIDSGTEDRSDYILDYLKTYNIKELEYAVATHPHSDHIGAMHKIISELNVNSIIMPDVANDIPEYNNLMNSIYAKQIQVIRALAGEVYTLGDSFFTVFAPNTHDYENMNDYSVVIKFVYGNNSFLFTGDCEKISEGEMISNGYELKSDILKVSHHGSSSSSCEEFLSLVNPTIAVISVGRDNQYDHPHDSVLDLLRKYNVEYFTTETYGTIVIVCDGVGFNVVTAKCLRVM